MTKFCSCFNTSDHELGPDTEFHDSFLYIIEYMGVPLSVSHDDVAISSTFQTVYKQFTCRTTFKAVRVLPYIGMAQ